MVRPAALFGLYVVLAVGLLLPWRGLLGHPEIDVWNHVWGYWWVADALASGSLPWRTELMGAPSGGVLWYVDLVGAVVQLPVTWALGPAAAYNVAMVGRVALAGLAGHLLAEALSRPGAHGAVGGVGFASAPMLLSEVHNGISEVVAVHWVGFTLLAAARAVAPGGRRRDWLAVGVLGGVSVLANFYYGLTSGLLVGLAVLLHARRVDGRWLDWRGPAAAVAVAVPLAAVALGALRASVAAPDALVRRSAELNVALAAHNAVDPRVYVMPGEFFSVDLLARYGEPFRHTGYLRITAIVLAVAALWRPGARRWAAVALASLVLGLGPFLWWDEAWVRAGGQLLMLPFGMMQRLVPELAITHPLRLSVGAQVLVPAIGAAALVGRRAGAVVAVCVLLVAETVWASVAVWPVPSSPTDVPAVYDEIAASPDRRAVLDLPAEVGTGMATSRYFWFQTVHGHPVPYKPDARAGSTGDPETFQWFPQPAALVGPAAGPVPSARATLGAPEAAHLRAVYGWVVLHLELDARLPEPGRLRTLVESALGPGAEEGGQVVWRLPPATPTAR